MNHWKRGLSLLLALIMCVSMLNLTVFAVEDENPTLDCGKEEHTHSIEARCYELTCGKETGEGASEGHAHTEDCYKTEASETPVCGQEEGAGAVEGHSHTDDCYERVEVPGEYTCENTEEGHEHGEGCPRAESTWTRGELTCELEEGAGAVEGHSHTDACFQTKTQVCGKDEAEEVPGHTHTDGCYTPNCNKEEHTHSQACYVSVTFDEETGTLTIIGTGVIGKDFTMADGSKLSEYKSKAQVLNVTGVELGEQVFYGWTQLTEVNLKDVASVGKLTFNYCTSLSTVTLENVNIPDNSTSPAFFQTGSADGMTVTAKGGYIGKNAFYQSKVKTVTIEDMAIIGKQAFWKCPLLTDVTLKNVGTIDGYAFANCNALTTLNIEGSLNTIGYNAFYNANLIGEYDLSNVQSIEFNAFSGNSQMKITVSGDTALSYSDNLLTAIDGLGNRIADILAGEFTLNPATEIKELAPSGWTSNRTGAKNDSTNYGGTQITKEARWTDVDRTTAEVQLQAYFTDNAQMDFVFVLDLSNSMAQVGNPAAGDKNARLYDMQSKLLDVTSQLLTAPGYDCHVAFTGFGEKSSQTSDQFYSNADDVATYITGLKPYYESTNYSLGLAPALKLVQTNTAAGRKTTVVFISDGQPYAGKDKPIPESYYGYTEAAAIKAAGAEIFAVLQSIPEGEIETAQQVMETVCTDGKYFTANQTSEFSEAVNGAIACGLGRYTLTDVVGSDFELDTSSIRASVGTVEVSTNEDGDTVLTWSIEGLPFSTYTLSYKENLKQVEGVYPTGSFDTNNGDVTVKNSKGEGVNSVATPILPRYTLTVNYVYDDGTTAAPSVSQVLDEGVEYNVASPAIEGYTADQDVVAGTMPAADVVETVTYTRNYVPPVITTTYYNLTINYVYADGTEAWPTVGPERHASGWSYSVASPVIEGYTADQTVVAGRLTRNTTVTVTYTAIPAAEYTLTVKYVYEDGSEAVADYTATLTEGAAYSVASPALEGYTADQSLVAGVMPAQDVTVTVVYTADEVIDEPDVPLSGDPTEEPTEEPTEDPGEELEDPDVPLSGEPTEDPAEEPTEDPTEELDDPQVPLDDSPDTGDTGRTVLWAGMFTASLTGLVILTAAGRKKEEEEG